MWMLFHLICPKGPLIFLHFLKIEKKNCCSAGMSSIVLSSSLLIHSSISFYLQLNPSNVLFSLVITSVWYFLSIEVHTVFSHSFPEFSAQLYDHGFEPFIRGIAYLHFGQFFFEVFFFFSPFDWNIFLVSSFCLILCVFSYVLGISVIFQSWKSGLTCGAQKLNAACPSCPLIVMGLQRSWSTGWPRPAVGPRSCSHRVLEGRALSWVPLRA